MAQHQSQLWKIARNPDISPDPCWGELEFWLDRYHVDVKSQTPEEWTKSLNEIRHKIEGIQKSAPAARSPSTESERQHEDDSGYGSSEKSDQLDAHPLIFALASGNETYPDGKVPLTFCHTDKYDVDYITDGACKAIGNPRIGRDGKVNFRYIPSGETKSVEGTFLVVNFDDGDADVGFKIKNTEETLETAVGEKSEDLVTEMQPHVEDQRGGILARRGTHGSTDIPIAVGTAFQPQAAQARTDADLMDLARNISVTVGLARGMALQSG